MIHLKDIDMKIIAIILCIFCLSFITFIIFSQDTKPKPVVATFNLENKGMTGDWKYLVLQLEIQYPLPLSLWEGMRCWSLMRLFYIQI